MSAVVPLSASSSQFSARSSSSVLPCSQFHGLSSSTVRLDAALSTKYSLFYQVNRQLQTATGKGCRPIVAMAGSGKVGDMSVIFPISPTFFGFCFISFQKCKSFKDQWSVALLKFCLLNALLRLDAHLASSDHFYWWISEIVCWIGVLRSSEAWFRLSHSAVKWFLFPFFVLDWSS